MGLFTQLTQEKRYHIYTFMKTAFSQADSAKEIGVNTSTVCRELRHNRMVSIPKILVTSI